MQRINLWIIKQKQRRLDINYGTVDDGHNNLFQKQLNVGSLGINWHGQIAW